MSREIRRRHLTLLGPPPPPPPTVPCQLRYLDGALAWWTCGQPAPVGRELTVAGRRRAVCAEHVDEIRRVETAGLADRLRWAQPAPTRRETQRPTVSAQLALFALPPPTRRRRAVPAAGGDS